MLWIKNCAVFQIFFSLCFVDRKPTAKSVVHPIAKRDVLASSLTLFYVCILIFLCSALFLASLWISASLQSP